MLYFDHNATTPPKPEALDEVRRAEALAFGNPSSLHRAGREARALLEEGRERLGKALGLRPAELVFTSGGTESNRLAIEGALEGLPPGGPLPHAVVAGIEHPSVLEVHARLAARGRVETTIVEAGEDGRVSAGRILAAVRPHTRVISLQHSNNETGVIQPVDEVAALLEARFPARRGEGRPLLHVDAVQSLGKVPVGPAASAAPAGPAAPGADLVTFSSHKVGGPKGAGALWVRPGRGYTPPVRGGPQERRMRPGTENLPAVLGFVRAVELAVAPAASGGLPGSGPAGLTLGSYLRRLLVERVEGVAFNGGPERVLPNTVNASFVGVDAELLVIRLDCEGVAVSMGSACSSGSREPSHVLKAMGLPPARISSSVRFSTGWTTRREEVEALVEIVARVVAGLRGLASSGGKR